MFKVWDASQGKTLEVNLNDTSSLTFKENEIIGKKSDAAIFKNTGVSEQRISLNAGWSWISFDVNDANFENLNGLTKGLNLHTDDRILSLSPAQLETYYVHPTDASKSGWSGTISANGGLSTSKMYKLNTQVAGNLIIKGQKVNLKEWAYPIKENWNWLPFVIGNNAPINDALAFFEPEDGDVIKSQNLFAIYDPLNGWTGTLNYLITGQGYMIKSSSEQTFKYPEYLSTATNAKSSDSNNDPEIGKEFAKYSENMNVIVQLPEGYTEVSIYSLDGILKGKTKTQDLSDKALGFLTVFGDRDEKLQFYISKGEGEQVTATTIDFAANKVVGTLDNPVVLDVVLDGFTAYPNPFEKNISVSLLASYNQTVTLKLFAASGQQVFKKEMTVETGRVQLDIQPEIANGVYFLTATVNGDTVSKLIVKK